MQSGLEDGYHEAQALLEDCSHFIQLSDRVIFDLMILNVEGRGVTVIMDVERGDDGENDDYIACQREVIQRISFEPPPPGAYGEIKLPMQVHEAETDDE